MGGGASIYISTTCARPVQQKPSYPMKTTRYFFFALVSVCSLLFITSCQEVKDDDMNDKSAIVGTETFVSSLSSYRAYITKSDELSEGEAQAMIEPIMALSIAYLDANDYDISEDFDDPDDPRIAWVALALAEYDRIFLPTTKTSVGGCVLQAIGVYEVLDAMGKKLIKALAKQALKKAVPYVGAALTVVDFVLCMVED